MGEHTSPTPRLDSSPKARLDGDSVATSGSRLSAREPKPSATLFQRSQQNNSVILPQPERWLLRTPLSRSRPSHPEIAEEIARIKSTLKVALPLGTMSQFAYTKMAM